MSVETQNPAEGYENYMGPAMFVPCADRLIDAASPEPGQRVLDLATGTGIVARRIVSRIGAAGTVTGLDISPNMLAVARDRASKEGLNIAWVEGPAEALPFPDAAFDLVTCQFGLMFFSDRTAALREVHRVLAPGGRVAFLVFQEIERHPFYVRLDEVIMARFGLSGVQDIFALGDRDTLRELVVGTGFRNIRIEPWSIVARFPNPDAFMAGEIDVDTAAIPAMQQVDAEERAAIVKELAARMRDDLAAITDGDVVAMPYETWIVTATR